MPILTFETVIEKPHAEVWSKLRDLRVARNYVPGVTDIEITTEQQEGVGVSRKVYMNGRSPVDETVIAWEERRGFTLKIHNGEKPAKPFSRATFQYAVVEAISRETAISGETTISGKTTIKLTFDYDVGMGAIGWLLDKLVLRRMLQKSNKTVAENMKKFYETGEPTNADLV